MLSSIVKSLYAEAPTKLLYHYTSLRGLQGMVDSRTLWVSEVRYLNDAEELRHINRWLQHEISAHLHDTSTNAHRRECLAQFSVWLPSRLQDGPMLFVGSFTENGNLLSQWRGYCPHGKGVSIGFGPTKIVVQAERASYLLGRCVYDSERKRTLAQDILQAVMTRADELGPRSRAHPSNSYYHVFQEVEPDLLRIAALLKDHSFHEELEWRVVSPVCNDYAEAPISFRDGKSMLIPYMEFPLARSDRGSLLIDHVFMGPTPDMNLAMHSLTRYFSRAGIHHQISNCQIPYRG